MERTLTERTLTPREATDVVEQRIEDFGLDSLPHVEVGLTPGGDWLISWENRQRVERPMTDAQWRDWLEHHVGTLEPEQLETLEG